MTEPEERYLKQGTECNLFEVVCTRGISASTFSQGIQDYPFSIGAPNCWFPSKSYFRVNMSMYAPGTTNPLLPSQMSAFADNAVGNLFDNIYVRAGQQDISSITQQAQQGSALKVRLNNTLPWLKAMGSSTAANESSFMKRLQAMSANAGSVLGAGPQLTRINAYADREIYRPTFSSNPINPGAPTVTSTYPGYASAQIQLTIPTNVVVQGPPVTATFTPGTAFGTAYSAGPPEEFGPDFINGMPSVNADGYPVNFGGSVLPGDILVVKGVEYEIISVSRAAGPPIVDTLILADVTANVALTADWFIVRGDAIRAKQASSTVYALWQPPCGIFQYDQPMGSGDYRIQLNPNVNYLLAAAESRNPLSITAGGRPYDLVVNDVKFYCYVEKMSIPDSVTDLHLMEMDIQSKQYAPSVQFSVPPSTMAITIFLQDNVAGSNPLIPPSMFKVLDNSDLALQNIQLTYANITKPSTNWNSDYKVAYTNGANTFGGSGLNLLEQRYHDSYEESGLDIKSCGCETFYDWLQRGPFYHFAFERDINNKSTEVQITSTFKSTFGNPGTNARMFIVAHYRKTVQITTANGLVVNVAKRDV